jgi:hypothetical protein
MIVQLAVPLTALLMSSTQALSIPRYQSTARSGNYVFTHERLGRASRSQMELEPLSSLGNDVVNGATLNGDSLMEKLDAIPSAPINAGELLPEAPPMSYSKFLTMQEKRAVVTIRYSGDAGLKPYFLTMAKKIKASHPDVIVERRILPPVVDGEASTFEVLVDGKVIIGKSRHRKGGGSSRGVEMPQNTRRSVFVSMSELDLAISRARRKQRPTTAYGGDDDNETKKTKPWLND